MSAKLNYAVINNYVIHNAEQGYYSQYPYYPVLTTAGYANCQIEKLKFMSVGVYLITSGVGSSAFKIDISDCPWMPATEMKRLPHNSEYKKDKEFAEALNENKTHIEWVDDAEASVMAEALRKEKKQVTA